MLGKDKPEPPAFVIIPSSVERYSQKAQAACWTLMCLAVAILTVKIFLQVRKEL